MKKNLVLILSCLTLVACNNTENKDEPTIDFEETKGEEVEKIDISFSDENLNKIIVEPTFEIDAHTNDGTNNIIPHQLFSSGMCLQRDSINRIWGKVNNSKNIAIEFNGIQHYQSVQHFGGQEAFIKRQKYDNIKKQWCERNNIKLIIIKYNENILKRLQMEGVIK